jgi:hypothetical protein
MWTAGCLCPEAGRRGSGLSGHRWRGVRRVQMCPLSLLSPLRPRSPRPFAPPPIRLIVSPPPLRLPGRCFLLRSRLWRWGCFNDGGIQEFAGAVHHGCKIKFPIRICDIYRARADNLQPRIRKPFCRFIRRQRDFAQFCRRDPKSSRQVRFQGIDIIIKKPDYFHSGS